MYATSMAPNPPLPLDILVSIIDIHKDNEDIQMLKSWSLVSSDFLFICRSHIYRSFDMRKFKDEITLYEASSSPGRTLFLKYYKLISSNPHLSPFVRTIHILETGSSDYLHIRPFAFICELPILARLLQLLPRLDCFGLHFVSQVLWTSLDHQVEGTLMDLCRRDCIRALHFEGIRRLPLRLLNSCTESLKELHLKDVMFLGSAATGSLTTGWNQGDTFKYKIEEEEHPRPRIYLDKATIISSQIEVFALEPPLLIIDITRLQDLTIDFNFHTLNNVWDIIYHARNSLRHLSLSQSERALGHSLYKLTSLFENIVTDVELQRPIEIASTHATLSHLSALSHLSITMVLPNTRHPAISERVVEEWCALLRTARHDSQLRTLTVVLNASCLHKVELGLLFSRRPINQVQDGSSRSVPEAKGAGKGKGKESEADSKNEDERSTILACLDETLSDAGLFPMLSSVTIDVRVPETHTILQASLGPAIDAVEVNSTSDMDGGSDQDRINTDSQMFFIPRPNLHSLRRRRKPRIITFEEIKLLIAGMMDRTRGRLREGPSMDADYFVVCVGVED